MTRSNRPLKDLLWTLALLGLVAGVFRLVFGLGATTNLTDAVPWGLWKVLNMIAGVALSTSGFTVGFLVYVLGYERFRPFVKPAVLIAFLGYGSSCLALLFDIGLPQRFWHPFVMWNEHSFLFEVFWCVMLYFTVTAIEMAPTVLERLRRERWARALHRVAFGVVVVGISLSSLHHSSLGSLFLVTPQRLHGLWYTPLLPLFFILSAMGCGLMFLVLVRILHAHGYDPGAVFGSGGAPVGLVCALTPRSGVQAAGSEATTATADGPAPAVVPPSVPRSGGRDLPALSQLAGIAAAILALYLVLKIADLLRGEGWDLLRAGTWESWLYAVELLLTAGLPVLLVAIRRVRRSPAGLSVAAASATCGLALNRLDVGILGYWRDAQTTYVPSLTEWVLGVGVVAAAGIAFLAAVETLPIFGPLPARPRRPLRPTFDAFTRVWNEALNSGWHRTSLIAVVVLPLGWVLMYPPYRHTDAEPVAPPFGVDATRSVLAIDGNRSGVRATFAHAEHQQRLGGDQSCVTCHHATLPGDRSTPCSRCHRAMLAATDIFDHREHMRAVARRERLGGARPENRSCQWCHATGLPRTAASAAGCATCHEKDMGLVPTAEPTVLPTLAISYLDAMHGTCLPCHRREEARGVKEGLAECGTCHPSLRRREVLVARR